MCTCQITIPKFRSNLILSNSFGTNIKMGGKTTPIMREFDAVMKCGPEKGHWVDVRMN